MKIKRWHYWLYLGVSMSAALLLGACGSTALDETDIYGTNDLDSENSSGTEGNGSFELTDNALSEDLDSAEEATETENVVQIGWAVKQNRILFDGQEVHTVPYIYSGLEEDIEVAFASDSSAYVPYYASEDSAVSVAVDYTHDGGVTWETTYVDNTLFTGRGNLYISFWDEMEGCLLYCSDPGVGQMDKVLYRTTDGGKSFETVCTLSEEIQNYPSDLAFCDCNKGMIVTQNHGDVNYAFLTEDGGTTWTDYRIEVPDEDSYRYIDASSIQKNADTGVWELVLRGATNDPEIGFQVIYCISTDDWETWQIQ